MTGRRVAAAFGALFTAAALGHSSDTVLCAGDVHDPPLDRDGVHWTPEDGEHGHAGHVRDPHACALRGVEVEAEPEEKEFDWWALVFFLDVAALAFDYVATR